MSTQIRILLADDHMILRQGLRSLLEGIPGVEVIGEAADGRSAVRLATELSPDVVVMDVSMPDLDGIEATRQIRGGGGSKPKVIALSAHADRRYTSQMLHAGACGYVSKISAFEELAAAVTAVINNKVYLSPALAGSLADLNPSSGVTSASSETAMLSLREQEVLQLTAEGLAMKEIATRLKVSVKTVETHRRKSMEKLGLYSVAELTKYAIREGLTALEA